MTLDVAIRESSNLERKSSLRLKRLWHAIYDLDEYELADFVRDAIPHIHVEEDYEVEFGLLNYLRETPEYNSEISVGKNEPIHLGQIAVDCKHTIQTERKFAFMRLWEHFDQKTKQAFLHRASSDQKRAGESL